MKLPDDLYDDCIEKIRVIMNHYGYQCRDMAEDILNEVSKPIYEHGHYHAVQTLTGE